MASGTLIMVSTSCGHGSPTLSCVSQVTWHLCYVTMDQYPKRLSLSVIVIMGPHVFRKSSEERSYIYKGRNGLCVHDIAFIFPFHPAFPCRTAASCKNFPRFHDDHIGKKYILS